MLIRGCVQCSAQPRAFILLKRCGVEGVNRSLVMSKLDYEKSEDGRRDAQCTACHGLCEQHQGQAGEGLSRLDRQSGHIPLPKLLKSIKVVWHMDMEEHMAMTKPNCAGCLQRKRNPDRPSCLCQKSSTKRRP